MSDHDLALALRALGHRLEAEPPPDLAPAVLARLGAAAAPRRRWQPLVLALAVLLVAAAAAVAASDRVRDFLFGAGVDVQRVATLPVVTTATTATSPVTTPAPHPPAGPAAFAPLGLGRPVTAAAAAAALGRDLPATALLGPPDAIFRADTADGPAVTLAWQPADPILLTVVPAHDENDPFLIGKELTEKTTAEFVQLPDGAGEGVFLSGAPHAVTLFDGRVVRFRLAEDVLLWRPPGNRVFRLEGRFDRARAEQLATSVR